MDPLQSRLFEPAIALHVLGALSAVALGIYMVAARKGTPAHRRVGRAWVAAMALTAASSFLISAQAMPLRTALGTFGPIHLLSAFTLWQLYRAVAAVRRGEVRVHRRAMVATFVSLVVAGLLALSPNRIMGHWLMAMAG